MRFARTIWIIGALLLAAPAIAATPLTPHSAVYKVKIKVISGQLNTQLRKTDDGYVANHVLKPTGMARLINRGTMDVTSEFIKTVNGVLPVEYRSIDTIRDDPAVELSFNWDENQAKGAVDGSPVLFPLDGVTHDSVSIQYAMMQDLLNGGVSDRYSLFDIDKTTLLNASSLGMRQVSTKAGKFTAVGIQHQKEGSSRITTLWCVEELGYLPVIIEQHRKGKLNFRASLVRYTPDEED
jgi:hypothetical protein